MPLSPQGSSLLGSFISTAGTALGGILGSRMQKRENERQREYEKQMYLRQYDDNLRLWQMQNEYNTPAQQMQRFKDAGLSPNLVYGQGTHGNAGNISAPSPSIADQSKNYVNPLANLGDNMPGMITGIYDLRLKAEQTNLLREQVETQNSVQKLNAITSLLKQTEIQRNQTSNKFDRQTYNTRINKLQSEAENIIVGMENTRMSTKTQLVDQDLKRAQTNSTIDQNVREAQKQNLTLKQMFENIKTSFLQQESLSANIGLTNEQKNKTILESNMKNLEIALAQQGYSATDSGMDRLLKGILNELGGSTGGQMGRVLPIQGFIHLIQKYGTKGKASGKGKGW